MMVLSGKMVKMYALQSAPMVSARVGSRCRHSKHTTKGRSKMKVKHYGANAVEVDGILVSYGTQVARIGDDGSFHRLWGGWTATTGRHINAFRESYGMCKISKSEWMKMEVENV